MKIKVTIALLLAGLAALFGAGRVLSDFFDRWAESIRQ